MTNIRQTVRFYSMWSKETMQRVYYHTEGTEFIAMVEKGVWYTGQSQQSGRLCASLILGTKSREDRKIIAVAARRLRTGDYKWEMAA